MCAARSLRSRLLGLSALALAAACARGPERPNVVLVTVDTLRADHLGFYGYHRETSPFLDELADGSLVFENAIAQCGTTPQSLSSLMTGLFPFTDGIVGKNGAFAFLRRGNRTLAGMLAEAGYVTHAVSSSIQAARVTGIDLGFGSFDGTQDRQGHRNRRASEVTTLALEWLEGRPEPEKPFFLWVHYLDPHHPYRAPESYAELWRDEEPREEGATRRYRFDPRHSMDEPVSEGELERLVIDYDREIRYLDDELRRLFEEGLGPLFDRSLVILSADHGESLGENRMIGHNDLFEPILRVPFLVRLPGGDPPRGRVDEPVMLVDVCPTVLDYVGVAEVPGLRGASLRPLLEEAGTLGERLRLAEYPGHQALYRGGHKVIRRSEGSMEGVALVDVSPGGEEHRAVGPGEGALVQRMLEEAEAMGRGARAPEAEGDEEPRPAVTPEMIEELRALGYAGS